MTEYERQTAQCRIVEQGIKLDFLRYRIIGIEDRRTGGKWMPVVLMASISTPTHYCIEYGGNGHYYDTVDGCAEWYKWRFGRPMPVDMMEGVIDDGKAEE